MLLRDYQQQAVESVYEYLRKKDGNPCVVIPTGGGKCLAEGTPILMFDGTIKPVEDIIIGDCLMGPDSTPRNVLALGRGQEMMYKVTPTKGDPYVVNESHILSLKLTPDEPGRHHELINLPVREYLARNKTFKHRAKGWRCAVDFPEKKVSVDPYFFGLWIADGSSDRVEISKPDPEVLKCVNETAASYGLSVRTKKASSCPSHFLSSGRHGRRKGRNLLLAQMQEMGVIGNKHIPHEYLANSRKVRLEVLAGLIDGDGSPSRAGFEFSSTIESVADGVCFLARSLGFSAYKAKRTTKCQTGASCVSFRVSISGDCQAIPTRIERKKPRKRTMNKDVLVHGIKVEQVGFGDYYGFEIDGDKLFLLGDFTVTHNTPVIATICHDVVKVWGGRVLVLAHVKELLEQSVDKIKKISPLLKVGVYSAGLKRRDTEHSVIVAGIQSVYDKAEKLGKFDIVLIDECFAGDTLVETNNGAKCIGALSPGDVVRNAFGYGTVKAVSRKQVSELYRLEFSDGTRITCTGNHPFFTERGWTEASQLMAGEVSFGVEAVQILRENILSGSMDLGERNRDGNQGGVLEQARLLLSILLEENEEPDEQSPVTIEDASDTKVDSAQADSSGRQRMSASSSSTGDAACPRGGMGVGIPRGSRHGEGQRVSNQLQDRHCQPGEENRDRTGREFSRTVFTEISGCEENGNAQVVRVVSVSRIEREGATTVFNLHVSGHPSYFANGRLVHNCHLIPTGGEGMYRTFISDLQGINPEIRIIGLTATPYRLGSGLICGPSNILTEICHETGVKELIVRGYLSKLVSRAADHEVDTSSIKIVRGEFDEKASEEAFCQDGVILEAATEICDRLAGRKSALIFCSTCKHAEMVGAAIGQIDPEGFQAVITGETPSQERADILDAFKRGIIKYLLNVNVLTTGFDAPNVDAVCMLRATTSPGLYYQIVGRGFRISEGKQDCLILDFGGNVVRHGPVDMIRSKSSTPESEKKNKGRICPVDTCRAVCSVKASVCPVCGFSFAKLEEAKDAPHQARSDEVAVVSDGKTPIENGEWFPVTSTSYSVHTKKNASDDTPKTLRVTYRIGFAKQFQEWVCVEHEGFAKNKANAWWQKRCLLPCPDSAETAVELADDKCLAEPASIKVFLKPGSQFPEIVGYDLPPPPDVEPPVVKEREPGIDDFDLEAMSFMDMLNARGMQAIEEEPPF